MSDQREIAATLKTLIDAYPDHRIEKRTLQVYLERLADIPAYLLAAAAQAHIESSTWFPKISELRQAAARLANTHDFSSLPPYPVDHLLAEAYALEDAFFYEGRLDPAEWERLADKFERVNRPYRADHTREKLRRLQTDSETQSQAS